MIWINEMDYYGISYVNRKMFFNKHYYYCLVNVFDVEGVFISKSSSVRLDSVDPILCIGKLRLRYVSKVMGSIKTILLTTKCMFLSDPIFSFKYKTMS